jgi:hypothetical protein
MAYDCRGIGSSRFRVRCLDGSSDVSAWRVCEGVAHWHLVLQWTIDCESSTSSFRGDSPPLSIPKLLPRLDARFVPGVFYGT